jgi:hypothetical protein
MKEAQPEKTNSFSTTLKANQSKGIESTGQDLKLKANQRVEIREFSQGHIGN